MADRPKRRWFRFRLRSLLILLTAAAIGSWLYWDGWPRYVVYREQMAFEAVVKQMEIGSGNVEDATRPLGGTAAWDQRLVEFGTVPTSKDSWSRYFLFEWPNAVYLVYVPDGRKQSPKIEVFRLEAGPRKYLPTSELGRRKVAERIAQKTTPDELSRIAYWFDFLAMVTSDRRNDIGFVYELIHADPPAVRTKVQARE